MLQVRFWVFFFCLLVLYKLHRSPKFILSFHENHKKALSPLPHPSPTGRGVPSALGWQRSHLRLSKNPRNGKKKSGKKKKRIILEASECIKVERLARNIIFGTEGCIEHPPGLWKWTLHYITHGGILLRTIKETVATKDRRDNLPSGIDGAFSIRAGLRVAAARVGAEARQDPNADRGRWTVDRRSSHRAAPQGNTGRFFCKRRTSVRTQSAGKGFFHHPRSCCVPFTCYQHASSGWLQDLIPA